MTSGPALQSLRVAIGVVPAVLVVAFAGLVASLALLMNSERRQYAIDFANVCTELAAVLVNGSRRNTDELTERKSPERGSNE